MRIWPRPIKNLSDENLMEMMGRGHTHAFDELYDRYAKRLHFFFLKMLNYDHAAADDFLQELFLKLIEKKETFSSDKKCKPWLYTIAANMCKNEYRRRSFQAPFEEEYADQDHSHQEPHFAYNLDAIALSAALGSNLSALDEPQRLVLVLRYYEELSIKEIPQIVGCAEGTVKSRLFYGLQKLATKLQAINPNL